MTDTTRYLQAYDEQLRGESETPSAIRSIRLGPIRLVTFAGGRGFISYRDLGEADAAGIAALVADALAYYQTDREITRVEWKTRSHDRAPGLHDALLANGFAPDEPESIMVGPLAALCAAVPTPAGVTLRQLHHEAEIRAMSAMVDGVFGEPPSAAIADSLLARLARADGMELWVAEADDRMVGAGRLEPVPGSDFAGIWGGVVLEEYRGRGIYRALTAARARSALELGKTLAHSDSTEYSRPILERSGLIRVSSTTPYEWTR
ncbi:GNAT family N-acetyltransferase [Microbacteriaceae bacterium VKM Ac-2854]|nr:GNAT family N-acetyltransferase [Microbacteriaceae bacterium VKM Ac-2854]